MLFTAMYLKSTATIPECGLVPLPVIADNVVLYSPVGKIIDGTKHQMECKRGITGSSIKIIAMVCMLIDHIGASVITRYILANPGMYFDSNGKLINTLPLIVIYYIMRGIGRIAFPIFIYLLVEGVRYTKNQWKYCGRMFLFAFISEIPFDMALKLKADSVFSGKLLEFGYQNVYFTLTIGIFVIILLDKINNAELSDNMLFLKGIARIIVVAAGMGVARLLRTDYSFVGVVAIVAAYMISINIRFAGRETAKRIAIVVVVCLILTLSSMMELIALVCLIPVCFYNGKRGLKLKWTFYLFYPLHLLILSLICLAMGI